MGGRDEAIDRYIKLYGELSVRLTVLELNAEIGVLTSAQVADGWNAYDAMQHALKAGGQATNERAQALADRLRRLDQSTRSDIQPR